MIGCFLCCHKDVCPPGKAFGLGGDLLNYGVVSLSEQSLFPMLSKDVRPGEGTELGLGEGLHNFIRVSLSGPRLTSAAVALERGH